ncbi:hypothetical protein [Ancylobacter mangrovi]|uniref:hypothetical protein n=1 Tax=Ancylobacter mangrovi TaxID=2972472 RepID=UPI002162E83F|nr:hypothetical protein [Ancylobacter mangrovi]MCS0503547.1 hypothetical protein [Ancylobacter mangrovi]
MARRRGTYLGGSTILQLKKPKKSSASLKSHFADSRYDSPPLTPEEELEREITITELFGPSTSFSASARTPKRR